MTEILQTIEQEVQAEAARADRKYPRYASHHEAYAILLEEVQEAWSELKGLRYALNLYWGAIRNNRTNDYADLLEEIREKALLCAAESVQAAAVCNRTLQGMEESTWNE